MDKAVVLVPTLLTLLSLAHGVALAQQTREDYERLVQERVAASTIVSKGATNPESIPFGEKMATAFRVLRNEEAASGDKARFRSEIAARFGGDSSDAQRISDYLAQEPAFRRQVREEGERGLDALCARVRETGQLMSAQEMASMLADIQAKRLALMEEHYRRALDGLKPTTRAAVLSHVEANIVPGLSYGRIDYMRLVFEAPDFVRESTVQNCERRTQAGDTLQQVSERGRGVDGTAPSE